MTPEQKLIRAVRTFIANDHPDNYIRMVRALQRLDGQDIDPEPPQWVPATWGDVQKSDRVRYQGHETVVQGVQYEAGIPYIDVKIRGRLFTYKLSEPVEIRMDSKRRAEHEGGIPF